MLLQQHEYAGRREHNTTVAGVLYRAHRPRFGVTHCGFSLAWLWWHHLPPLVWTRQPHGQPCEGKSGAGDKGVPPPHSPRADRAPRRGIPDWAVTARGKEAEGGDVCGYGICLPQHGLRAPSPCFPRNGSTPACRWEGENDTKQELERTLGPAIWFGTEV